MSIQQHEIVNTIALVGEFGFLDVEGPFDYEKDGTVWSVSIPTDTDDHAAPPRGSLHTLRDAEDKCAVAIADCEVVAGGIVVAADEPEGEEKIILAVDQYAMGDVDA